jgi:hypothetical protein
MIVIHSSVILLSVLVVPTSCGDEVLLHVQQNIRLEALHIGLHVGTLIRGQLIVIEHLGEWVESFRDFVIQK